MLPCPASGPPPFDHVAWPEYAIELSFVSAYQPDRLFLTVVRYVDNEDSIICGGSGGCDSRRTACLGRSDLYIIAELRGEDLGFAAFAVLPHSRVDSLCAS